MAAKKKTVRNLSDGKSHTAGSVRSFTEWTPTRLRTAELIALGEVPGQARAAAAELVARHATTGRWLGDRLAHDTAMLSGLWGLVGVARTLLRADGYGIPALRDAYRVDPHAAGAPPEGPIRTTRTGSAGLLLIERPRRDGES